MLPYCIEASTVIASAVSPSILTSSAVTLIMKSSPTLSAVPAVKVGASLIVIVDDESKYCLPSGCNTEVSFSLLAVKLIV